MNRFSRKKLLIVTAILVVGLIAVSWRPRDAAFNELEFTPAAWAKADNVERAKMSGDLVRNHLLRGLSRSQVESLIGKTRHTINPSDADGFKVRGAVTHEYGIDNLGDPVWDNAFVYVHYDANGKVVSAEVTGY
jgi:hypothetical protein